MSALGEFIARLPKAELHLHLEGAVSPELFAHLRDKYDVPALEGGETEAGQFKDLAAFLAVYQQVCSCMRSREDFRETTYAALERAAGSGARYVEMFFSPAAHETVIDYRSMVDGIVDGMHAARKEFGLLARLIPAHNRELGLDRGMAFLDTVLNYRPPKVIGIGLDYAGRPHPPAGLFATTLNREYTLAAEAFGLSQATLGEIAANGLNHGWSPRSAALAADERR